MAGEKQYEEHPIKEVRDAADSEVSSNSPSAATLKAAHRKVDKRLLCWYAFVYLIMRIHVSNISNTAIMNLEQGTGIKKQLGNLSSSQWAWALSIFYYPYLFFEPLATLMLKKFSPSVWMSRIMITWGIISMCQGATHNYSGILACRFFLGAAEAGFCTYQIREPHEEQVLSHAFNRSRGVVSPVVLVPDRATAAAHRVLLCLWHVFWNDKRFARIRH
jgi:hypothetical protein